MTSSDDKETLLTAPAKEAIRSYMIKLITLPAIGAAILSFLVGFGINEIARGQAYTAAFQRYAGSFEASFKTIVDAATQVGGAKDSADRVATELRMLREQVRQTIEDINSSKGQVDQILKQNIAGIADKIINTQVLRDRIIRVENAQLADLADQIKDVQSTTTRLRSDLRSDLQQWGTETKSSRGSGLGGGGSVFPPSTCPEGSYAVGISASGSTGQYCYGCLVNVQVVCRSLNLK